jgi:hypothetical protein
MTPKHLPEIPAYFYRTTGGTEPVLDWLRSLPLDDRRAIGTDLATVQFGWPIGMPLCRALGGVYGRSAARCQAGASLACCFLLMKGELA